MGRTLFACVDISTHRIEEVKAPIQKVSHLSSRVGSVKPSDTKKKKKTKKTKKKRKRTKEKSIKFHKLFVLKSIFSVSDPQLFY